jgi:hypothetical protein
VIELIVAVAVAAAAELPAKRKLATNRLKIAFKKSRMLVPPPSFARLLGRQSGISDVNPDLDWPAAERLANAEFESVSSASACTGLPRRRKL